YVVAALDPASPQRVNGDRHGLRKRRRLSIQPVVADVDAGRRRDGAELREGCMPLQPDRRVLRAEIRAARSTLEASSAGDAGSAGDARAELEGLGAGPSSDDAAGELVPWNERSTVPGHRVPLNRVGPWSVHELAGIGPADACRLDLEEELTRVRRRVRSILEPDVAGAVVDGRSHPRAPLMLLIYSPPVR